MYENPLNQLPRAVAPSLNPPPMATAAAPVAWPPTHTDSPWHAGSFEPVEDTHWGAVAVIGVVSVAFVIGAVLFSTGMLLIPVGLIAATLIRMAR